MNSDQYSRQSVLQNSVTKSHIYIGDVQMEALGVIGFFRYKEE